jgi:D-sedoheptulose 7-phosphate isomerase
MLEPHMLSAYPSSGQLSLHELDPGRAAKLAGAWSVNVHCLATFLEGMAVTDLDGQTLEHDQAFAWWTAVTEEIRAAAGTVYLVGNGASASMASHLAADLAKNGQLHTEVFSDLSLITAIANDMDFSEVFSVPLKRRLKPGDMLVAISSSGGSPNVLKAANAAREMGGFVATVSAMRAGNPVRASGDLNFYVSAPTYGEAETCHAAILHHWMDLVSGGLAAARQAQEVMGK